MQLVLFDTSRRNYLLPFTHTRPIADVRCGIYTMRERWQKLLNQKATTLTASYLQAAFPFENEGSSFIYVNASIVGTPQLKAAIASLNDEQYLYHNEIVIGLKTQKRFFDYDELMSSLDNYKSVPYHEEVMCINNIWDIFSLNEKAIAIDFDLITSNRTSATLPHYVTAIHPENIFVEEGATIMPCILNATSGKIYIAKDTEIMEGSSIRGSFALCEHGVVKMGTKMYGATTIGPGCKVGGEITNAVFFANSNKGHDGFIGNAVIGEWCNLGADTNCSNLKNNYDEIKIWNEHENKSVKSGLQFCGLMMGDHSKCGINTMFNTGTVVGVSCNIYGGGFLQKFIPSFSWGDNQEMVTYKLEKAIDTANRMMARRGKSLSEAEINMLKYVFDTTAKQRELLS